MGKTPVAIGSKLPVWPAFAAPYKRLTCWSAPFDVIPAGLSSSNMPSSGRPFPFLLANAATLARLRAALVSRPDQSDRPSRGSHQNETSASV